MPICANCGGEIANKFLTTACFACIEKAMDALTTVDIAEAMNDLAQRGVSITRTSASGEVVRVDPDDFYLPTKTND